MAKTFPFKRNEVIRNTIRCYPSNNFFLYDQKIYWQNMPEVTGSFVNNIGCVPVGSLSVYEENIDRQPSQYIYPFIVKDGTLNSFKTISEDDFHDNYSYGDKVTGSYPLSARLSRDYYAAGSSRTQLESIQNALNNDKLRSPHFAYTSNLGDKSSDALNLISISNLYYGSQIRPGSISLKYYISGSLIGELQDWRKNGELVQVGPAGSLGSGSVAGVVLYKEGFLVLTGAWNITNEFKEPYITSDATTYNPKWLYFASTGSSPVGPNLWNLPSSSFNMYFEGINYVNTLTMFCHARMNELNCSQNPTWLNYGQALTGAFSGSKEFREWDKKTIKNIVKTKWSGKPTGSFEKITYISTINIHNETGDIIARAKLATPTKKTEDRAFTYKIKLDVV
jgi:hypothetical protein